MERSKTIYAIQISDIHVWKPPNKSYGVRQITLWVPPSNSYGGRQINMTADIWNFVRSLLKMISKRFGAIYHSHGFRYNNNSEYCWRNQIMRLDGIKNFKGAKLWNISNRYHSPTWNWAIDIEGTCHVFKCGKAWLKKVWQTDRLKMGTNKWTLPMFP